MKRTRFRMRVSKALDAGWLVVLVILGLWIFHRLGGFQLWSLVSLPDGTTERIVRTFGAVDHPFHATRAELLLQSLRQGDLLRWISAHQGGYPVEFYPLGAAGFEVVVWTLLLGLLPIMAVHKIAVIIIFLLPALGFLLLARNDRLPLGVGVLALVFHVSARGWWWSGGYMELVDWGLVSSFLAMTAVLLFLPVSFWAIRERSIRWGAMAGIVASFAVYTNVRSFLPLGAMAIGTMISLVWESDRKDALRGKSIMAATIVAVAGLVSAPLLIALIRFQDLYFFVNYERYDTFREYWNASITGVSGPFFVLAFVGLIGVFWRSDLIAGRLVAFTLLTYILMTILLSGLTFGPTIEQLEAIRLMPVQRILTLYLAALGVAIPLTWFARRIGRFRIAFVHLGLLTVAIGALVLYTVWDSTPIHESDRSLYPVLTTGDGYMVAQERAIELADAQAEPGTAILVLGNILSWHDQFWSFQWSDRPFFFDDWLWYWQRDHFGPYDPSMQNAYPDRTEVLDAEYFQVHGIGAVVAGPQAIGAATASPLLEPISQDSDYQVFLVENPTPIITNGDTAPLSIDLRNQRFVADFDQPATTFLVRRNWFPRWKATVDGRTATITKDDHGYMNVTSVTPGTHVELVYGVDGWDWLGRILLAGGIAIAAVAIIQPRRFAHLLRIDTIDSPGTGPMTGTSGSIV